jgi:hypothetical protein
VGQINSGVDIFGMLSSSLVLFGHFSYALASWNSDAEETNKILEEVQQYAKSPMPIAAQSVNITPCWARPHKDGAFKSAA